MRYTFGPILSRRFGLSLGVDVNPDTKVCNYDCIYCELGGAKAQGALKNEAKTEDIVAEVRKRIEIEPSIDVITITSNGEPTLYKKLGKLVDELNKIKQEKKLLILSNASTIADEKIQKILQNIDIVKLSLDCISKKCFKKIDRPLEGIDIEKIIKGIVDFRKRFQNELVIEILVVKGVNDKKEEFEELNRVLNMIKPDRVDLGTIDRPPAYGVQPVKMQKLLDLSSELKNIPVNLVYKKEYKQKKIDFTKDEIISILKRRPQTYEDIEIFFSTQSKKNLKELLDKKIVSIKKIASVEFYCLTPLSNPHSI
jgi:wyosine [tRNA(Phe)-imidazoG37] synthetase (radical SAM superfamily)